MRSLVLISLIVTPVWITGCASEAPLPRLEPMAGVFRFTGFTVQDKRIHISGTTTQCFSPSGEALYIHFQQDQNFKEEAFGVVRWDADRDVYAMTWESSGLPDQKLECSGNFNDKGHLALHGTMTVPKIGGEGMEKEDRVYTWSFPDEDSLVFTVKIPMVGGKASYESFRYLAQRKDGPPDAVAFEARFMKRCAEMRKKPPR